MPDERTPNPGAGSIGGAITGAAAGAGFALGGPAGAATAAGVAQQTVAPLDSLDALRDGAAAVRRWVSDRHNWLRVSWFGSGVILFAVGAAMVAGKPAGAAVSTVIPAGKAAKAMGAIK